MAEPGNKTDALDYAPPARRRPGVRYYVGLLLWNLGMVTTIMFTTKHFMEQPREPLGFDLTLRWGYGGFIAYGVAAWVAGFLLILSGRKRQ